MKKKAILTLGISLMLTMSLLLGGCGTIRISIRRKRQKRKQKNRKKS